MRKRLLDTLTAFMLLFLMVAGMWAAYVMGAMVAENVPVEGPYRDRVVSSCVCREVR